MSKDDKKREIADNLLSKGEAAQAIAIYSTLAKTDTDYQVLNNLAVAHKEIGEIEIAIQYMERSTQIKKSSDSLTNLANMYHLSGRVNDAIKCCQDALEENPENENGYILLVEIFNEIGQYDTALKIVNLARKVSESAEIMNTLGNVKRKMKSYDEALAAFESSFKLAPNSGTAMNVAIMLHRQGRWVESEKYFKESIQINSYNTEAHIGLGNLLIELERYDEALSVFVKIDNNLSRARRLECLWEKKRYQELIENITSEKEQNPTNIRVAALSSFAARQLDIADPYNWIDDPLEKILNTQIAHSHEENERIIALTLDAIQKAPTEWEPESRTTKMGSQTIGNLFQTVGVELDELKKIIIQKIHLYIETYHRYDDRLFDHAVVQEENLNAWSVTLSAQGHQENHIHPSAILSGVIYLKVPDEVNHGQGAIEFNTDGYSFLTKLRKVDYKLLIHPKVGQILIFPSSLFHRTIPTETHSERVSIAFDLLLKQ